MGVCLSSAIPAALAGSSQSEDRRPPTVNVISGNGDLHQYAVPLTVSQVLLMEFITPSSSSSNSKSSLKFFVCNSDHLYYDDYIPALDAEHELHAGQIYFVLPASKLRYRLTASDMAALAVKASVALHKTSTNINKKKGSSSSSSSSSSFFRHHRRRRQNKMARISPVLEEVNNNNNNNNHKVRSYDGNGDGGYQVDRDEQVMTVKKGFSEKREALGVSRSGSASKLQRYSSRRAKMAVRFFRLGLTTIYEGSVLHFY